jgi:RNA polymerase sigma factor (sigma-70 family)
VNLSLTSCRRGSGGTYGDERRARSRGSVAGIEPAEELHRKLYEAIAQLNPKAASILILRYLHNYSDADIAKLLGTSRGVIAVTLYRSRARLKKLMGASLGEES